MDRSLDLNVDAKGRKYVGASAGKMIVKSPLNIAIFRAFLRI
ncbi:hypothetical protein [Novosphingobium kaempferiae]|nr:hypothetical protein [Novosphingobium kaempferiae]